MARPQKTARKQAPQPAPEAASRDIKRFFPLLVVLLPFLLFFPSVFGSFLNWDDTLYVLNNPMVQDFSIPQLQAIFTTSFDGHYHPLLLLSFALDHLIAGNAAWYFHLMNVLLHTASTLLVYRIVQRLYPQPAVALLTALFWSLHPLMAESVAWITARKDVLFGFFFLLSLLHYLKYTDTSLRKHRILALLFFLLSAAAKEQAAFLAPTLLVVDYLRQRDFRKAGLWLEKIPFFLIALAFGLATMWAQAQTGYIKPLSGETVSFANRLLLGCSGLLMYLLKWIAPLNLSAYYPYPFEALKPAPGLFWLTTLVIPALLFLLFWLPRKSRQLTFGLWFFLINIFVMLRFLQANPGDFYIAERYMYIASFGLTFAVACGISGFIAETAKYSRIVLPLLFILLLTFSGLTFARVLVWRDSMSLLNNTLAQFPKAYTALNCRGDLFMEQGNLPAALNDFDQAVRINPHNDRAFANRGRARAMAGNIEGALSDLDRAVALSPREAANYVNRGIARDLKGDAEGAFADMNTALRLQPGFAEAWAGRARISTRSGRFEEALRDYNKALQLNPANAAFFLGRGSAFAGMNQPQSASADFEKARQMGFTGAELDYQCGLNAYRQRQFQQALNFFKTVTAKQPANAAGWAYQGFAEYNLERYTDAIRSLNEAVRLDPGAHLTYAMRGMACIKSGDVLSGCSDLRLAASLGNSVAENEYKKYCGD